MPTPTNSSPKPPPPASAATPTTATPPSAPPTNATLYRLSIAQVLGDNGTAIQHAATIRPADIPTPERHGRYWIDVARAYHQWGKPEHCTATERCCPPNAQPQTKSTPARRYTA